MVDGKGMFPSDAEAMSDVPIIGDDRYLSMDEVARLLNVSPRAIPYLQLQGALHCYIVNGVLHRFRQSEVLAYKAQRDAERRNATPPRAKTKKHGKERKDGK